MPAAGFLPAPAPACPLPTTPASEGTPLVRPPASAASPAPALAIPTETARGTLAVLGADPHIVLPGFLGRLTDSLIHAGQVGLGAFEHLITAIADRLGIEAHVLSFLSKTSDAELAAMPSSTLAVIADELLEHVERSRNAQERARSAEQFMRVIQAHGPVAGRVAAILEQMPHPERLPALLPPDAREAYTALMDVTPLEVGDWDGFQRYMDAATATRERPGSKVEPLIDGDTAFPEMYRAIDGARETVNWTTFAFQSDAAGWEAARHLAAAADRGCHVRLVYDPVGSRSSNGGRTDPAVYEFLRRRGVQVIAAPPGTLASHLTHRKILVVDGRTAFTGGMNVGNEYRHEWHDVMARVTGPAVRDLQGLFVDQWKTEGGRLDDAEVERMNPPLATDSEGEGVRVVGHDGWQDCSLRLAYLRAIDTASRSIHVANPYVSDPDVLRHLAAASRRGVEVVLVLPKRNNEGAVQAAEHAWYDDLIAAGVHLHEYSGHSMAHEKVATFDGRVATIGSSNLDHRSLVNNDEANVWTRDPRVAESLDARIFGEDLAKSTRVTEYHPGVLESIMDGIAEGLSSEL